MEYVYTRRITNEQRRRTFDISARTTWKAIILCLHRLLVFDSFNQSALFGDRPTTPVPSLRPPERQQWTCVDRRSRTEREREGEIRMFRLLLIESNHTYSLPLSPVDMFIYLNIHQSFPSSLSLVGIEHARPFLLLIILLASMYRSLFLSVGWKN